MIWIKNKWLPFKGFTALTVWPFVFYRDLITEETRNHERIRGRQQLELLLIGFYLIYFVECILKGYDRISFEREAYANESNMDYLKKRKFCNFVKYF